MTALGAYNLETAEQAKNRLDSRLGSIEHHFRRLKEAVPGAATPVSRLDELLDEVRDVVADLHSIVDKRTDREAA